MTTNPRHIPHEITSVAEEHTKIILDASKIEWHMDRVRQWERANVK